MTTTIRRSAMTFPTSNVRVGRVLTLDSFYGCEDCAAGRHGEDGTTPICPCCKWHESYRAGSFIPTKEVSS